MSATFNIIVISPYNSQAGVKYPFNPAGRWHPGLNDSTVFHSIPHVKFRMFAKENRENYLRNKIFKNNLSSVFLFV